MYYFETPIYLIIAAALWVTGLILISFKSKKIVRAIGHSMLILGIIVLAVYIFVIPEFILKTPFYADDKPLLQYSVLIPVISYIIYLKQKFKWLLYLAITASLALLAGHYFFLPALPAKIVRTEYQNIWYLPHIILNKLSYVIFSVSFITSLYGLKFHPKKVLDNINLTVNWLIYAGFSFLIFGIILGVVWANQTLGKYWVWETRECWAIFIFFVYLTYIHIRNFYPQYIKLNLWIAVFAFVLIITVWVIINYYPGFSLVFF